MDAVEVICEGRVQGVFFRVSTQKQAQQLGLTGWVKNEVDGRVKINAIGSSERLDEFINWCRHGPPAARVSQVKVKQIKIAEYPDFEIRY